MLGGIVDVLGGKVAVLGGKVAVFGGKVSVLGGGVAVLSFKVSMLGGKISRFSKFCFIFFDNNPEYSRIVFLRIVRFFYKLFVFCP